MNKKSQRQKHFYAMDSFIDSERKTHHFVICAILNETLQVHKDGFRQILKHLSLGAAVSKPDQEFEEDLGKNIAFNRANRDKSKLGELFTNNVNMLSEQMIRYILQNEVEHIKANPVKFMKMLGRKKASYKQNVERELVNELEQ